MLKIATQKKSYHTQQPIDNKTTFSKKPKAVKGGQGQNDLITKVKQAEAKLGCSKKLRQIDAKLRQIEANAAKLRQMQPNLGKLRQI